MTDGPIIRVSHRPVQTMNMYRQVHLYARQQAIADLGRGEQGRNNWGPYVLGLRGIKWPPMGKVTAGAWCQRAVQSWVRAAHADAGALYLFQETGSGLKFTREMMNRGGTFIPPTQVPPIGSIVLWKRGTANWMRHIGIVKETYSDGEFQTIEGNVGKFPAKVKVFDHYLNERKLIGFYWLGPYE